MKVMGLQGVVRGKKVITTNPIRPNPCPDDKVNRAFVADMPNELGFGFHRQLPPGRVWFRRLVTDASLPARSSAGASGRR